MPLATKTWKPVPLSSGITKSSGNSCCRDRRLRAAVSGAALQGLSRNPLVDPGYYRRDIGGRIWRNAGRSEFPAMALSIAFCFGIGSYAFSDRAAQDQHADHSGRCRDSFFPPPSPLMPIPFKNYPHRLLAQALASSNYADLLVRPRYCPHPSRSICCVFRLIFYRLGTEKARALGSPVMLVLWIVLIATALISATSGIIGWVGLDIPHVARALLGAPSQITAGFRCVGRDLPADGR